MIGIHINDSKFPYTDMILCGGKKMETRFKPTLHPFIGQRVAIIRTGKGPATIVGTVKILDAAWCDRETFKHIRFLHMVRSGSKEDVGDRVHCGKWCYRLREPVRLEKPIVIGSKGFTGNRTYRIVDIEEG